ncbi:hypothetical protein QFZ27_000163 [Inquilinus ginsengisoli]|uniref:hypothetical protein n=1 Tax=Inquilinus ginsengisoli TaxID=363840 RepID=UPI003D1A782D
MSMLNTAAPVAADIVEFEAATRKALKAMRSGDPQRMCDAFLRYMDISIRMAAKPYEQIVADARLIERRGRIDLDDHKRINAALYAFCGEVEPTAQARGIPVVASAAPLH